MSAPKFNENNEFVWSQVMFIPETLKAQMYYIGEAALPVIAGVLCLSVGVHWVRRFMHV